MTSITEDVFGSLEDGRQITRYTLCRGDLSVQIINYGATITSLKVGDIDILLGFDNIEGYQSKTGGRNPYMGAVIGRVGNRIAEAKFTLDGKEYVLAQNNGLNALHGGLVGFDKVMWRGNIVNQADTLKHRLVTMENMIDL